ncbi:MAG TPA: hemolysin family protein [Blastocatellia bacterium]|nr:hemolysin family protein [Blastocatellia bacterium]
MEYEIALTGICLLVLVFLSIIESAYGHLSDVGLRILLSEHEDSPAAKFLRELVDNYQRFSLTLITGIQLSLIAVVLLSGHIIQQLGVSWQLVVAFIVGLITIILFHQFLPNLIAQSAPDTVLLKLLPIFRVFYIGLSPLVWPVYSSLRRFRLPQPKEPAPQEEEDQNDELQALIDVGEEAGIIEEEEGELIQSIVEFSDTAVREIMTPRTKITAIESTATVREARDMIIAAKFSRMPVYREQIDNIEGIIYVRDLLTYWQEGRDNEPVIKLIRPAYFVPESKAVADLLEDMQKSKVQIAIVIDEYGGIAGLVTLEDILEEIVGEIEDEDRPPEVVTEREIVDEPDGSYLVKGDTEVRKLELLFDEEMEADDFTTVGGMLLNKLGHMPAVGEQIEFQGHTYEVVDTEPNRILRVRIRPVQHAAVPDEAA